ncbi:MAG: M14 family metallopeptidase [Bacteroidales bacterium]|nr:M14 family metallopeptidase [Bacteroidales bacterium]
MKITSRILRSLLLVSLLCPTLIFPAKAQMAGFNQALLTRAEKTNYQETSMNADVVKFIEALKETCPLVTVEQFGTTKLGNPLQLVIMANPKISSPAEALASGKPVIYIQSNIHAGEVEGKEASMTLMRDIASGSRKYLLDNQIILFCPNYNPDGNDKLAENNRYSQEGSPKLAGVRESGEGLDLNRDGMKAASIEMKALLKGVFNRWDPALFMDMHADNGSWHGYIDNVAPSFQSAGLPEPVSFTTGIIKDAFKSVLDKSGLNIFWHGYLSMRPGEQPTFTSYDYRPRFITNYIGLRNRMGILSESFPHDLFEKRILSNYYLLVSVLEYTGSHAQEVKNVVAGADRATIDLIKTQAGKIQRGLSYELAPEPELISMLIRETYSTKEANGRVRLHPTGKLNRIDSVKQFNHFVPVKLATVPRAYYFPARLTAVARNLEDHGIIVRKTDKKISVVGEEFLITKLVQEPQKGPWGNKKVELEGNFRPVKKSVPAGSYYVDMAQPLAWLIFYLLEPQSDDGLLYWDFFNDYLKEKGIEKGNVVYPVVKAMGI